MYIIMNRLCIKSCLNPLIDPKSNLHKSVEIKFGFVCWARRISGDGKLGERECDERDRWRHEACEKAKEAVAAAIQY